MEEESIFTKIIKGDIPCYKVYEDDKTIAFMSLQFIGLGQVLVVPKIQIDQFFQLSDEDYTALMLTVKKVALRMKEVIKSERIGIKVEGLEVPHTHVKLIAFNNHDQYNEFEDIHKPVDGEKLKEMAEKLAF